MPSLASLTDEQNLLLTQLSYCSHVLINDYYGMTLEKVKKDISDDEALKILDELCDAGLGELCIKDVGNDPITGFGAVAFTDGCGNIGFSFRGTDGIKLESANDWADNVMAMITGTSFQTLQAEIFFQQNCSSLGNNYFYGHSKGGELVESVYVNNYSDIKEIHLLNPQPINPYSLSLDQFVAMQSDKVDIIIVEGDYVWFLGRLPSYGNIRIAQSIPQSSAWSHHLYDSIGDMFDSNGNITQGTQPWWEYPAYYFIKNLTGKTQMYGGLMGLVYNSVVQVVNYVRKDLIPDAYEFIARLEKIAQCYKEIETFFSDLKQFLAFVIEKAIVIYDAMNRVGSRPAVICSQIAVNTDRLRIYSQRLQSVCRRAADIESRIEFLCRRTGSMELMHVARSDAFRTDSLYRCASYLNDAAEGFDHAETSITNYLRRA